jgi:hypothetical protein
MEFRKKDLLSLLKEDITEMPMDFDTPDRPDDSIQDKLSRRDNPLKKIPFPKTGEEPRQNFQELLASERYKKVLSNLRRYLGDNVPTQRGMDGYMQLGPTLMRAHNKIIQLESQNKKELEDLAVELVMLQMGLSEGDIEFDAKIVTQQEISIDDFNRDNDDENPDEVNIENEIEILNDLEKFDLERAKRRLINNIIQGASKKGHYMFNLMPERLQQITGEPNILNIYGTLMSILDLGYWQASDELLKGEQERSVAGKQTVEPPEDEEGTAKVIARGINFPVLIHELIKGVMEVMALQGRPDNDSWSDVEKSEDTLEKEIWDIRLGPEIWDRIRSQFPEEILIDENKYDLQNFLLNSIFKLPAREFLVFMKEVLSGSEQGKKLMSDLFKGIDDMFKDYEYQLAISEFQDNLEDISDNTDDDDLEDFLGGLGIRFSDDD